MTLPSEAPALPPPQEKTYLPLLTAVLFSYFFTGIPMLCELEIWVLELLMAFAPAKIYRDFYKKVSACHLKFSEYF